MASLKFGFCGFTQEQLEHVPVLRLLSITVFFPIFVNLITTLCDFTFEYDYFTFHLGVKL